MTEEQLVTIIAVVLFSRPNAQPLRLGECVRLAQSYVTVIREQLREDNAKEK